MRLTNSRPVCTYSACAGASARQFNAKKAFLFKGSVGVGKQSRRQVPTPVDCNCATAVCKNHCRCAALVGKVVTFQLLRCIGSAAEYMSTACVVSARNYRAVLPQLDTSHSCPSPCFVHVTLDHSQSCETNARSNHVRTWLSNDSKLMRAHNSTAPSRL